MVSDEWHIFYFKKALKDIENLKAVHLDKKAKALIEMIKNNPFHTPPPYEKLQGDLHGFYSRRINHKHRLVYLVDEEKRQIRVVSM